MLHMLNSTNVHGACRSHTPHAPIQKSNCAIVKHRDLKNQDSRYEY
ncbi:hypothetical protein HanHA300_Chr09g0321701 [Helianthus annuus]|nr:hypothetical protein HanHA300_Chr09g0321701 [Helianthus annuus]KAJ0534718.1 hypothetical protein HanIR_Chr09g0422821 [Helianthus annuus]KAJ0542700.1 hypothetical protein HanHA89_Chr09g0342651 [Helianthus annuus]KAJ0707760.1 hypothetical protein HanLR1_Chr09g0321981 [Helianthus annuus]